MTMPQTPELRLLAVDTASETGSVAVMEGGRLLSEITIARKETHSKRLMTLIQLALEMADLAAGALDGLAFVRGPGSFTGLRIGLGVIKGMAFGLGKPMVGVSSLQVLAHQAADSERLLCPMLDARNKEVYCARYRLTDEGLFEMDGEKAVSPEGSIVGIDTPCLLIGEGASRYRSFYEERLGPLARFASPHAGIPRAATVARLGSALLQSGRIDELRTCSPTYLRKAYAESFLDRTAGSC